MTDEQGDSGSADEARCDAVAAEWDRRLAAAGAALDAASPSPELWDRIAARLDQLEAARATLTVPREAGVWQKVGPGVQRKLLYVDAVGGWNAYMMRVEPGAGVGPHGHSMLEECLVLEGSFEVDGTTVRKGDFHLGFAGHHHGALVSREGALLYIRGPIGP